MMETVAIGLRLLQGTARHHGSALVVNLEHQPGRFVLRVSEQLAEHPYDVGHQVDRVVPHHHLPRLIEGVTLFGLRVVDGCSGRGRHAVWWRPSSLAAKRWALSQSSKSNRDTRHSLPIFTAGSSPDRSTRVTTKGDTSKYSQTSATDSQSLARSTVMRSTCPRVPARHHGRKGAGTK